MRTETDNAYTIALAGIQSGMQRMAKASAALSRDVAVEPIIEMKLAEVQVKASAKVVKAVDDSLGQLIDMLA